MNLWPHQQKAIDELTPLINAGGHRVVAAAPTGAGKSLIMRRLCQQGKTVAVYTHRRMLLDQMAEGLRKDGIDFGFVAAGMEADISAPVQLCMVQTVAAKMQSMAYDVPRVDVVMDDECHADKGSRKFAILDAHHEHGSTIIGWTATPLDLGGLYDDLVVFAKNSDLRRCGAHVPADTFAPSEIELENLRDDPEKLLGKTYASETYRQAIFGEVKKHWLDLNPDLTPTVLFAPGVRESIWFAQHFTANGFRAAHIDGSKVWVDGEEHESTPEIRQQIKSDVASGAIKLVSNRFVLREGVDIPELQHLIYATPMSSLCGYLQSGGRVLRSHPSHDRVTIQDHGGNHYRHGSLNADREWDIYKDDAAMVRERKEQIIKGKESGEKDIEPIVCVKCGKCRASGPECPNCGHCSKLRSRKVIQASGSLRLIKGDVYRPRKVSNKPQDQKVWERCYYAAKNSGRSFRQAESNFRYKTGVWPDQSWPLMPKSSQDRHLKVKDVPFDRLIPQQNYVEGVA